MSKIHINSNGEPGTCKATTKPCPFGDESTHFSSAEDASEAYSQAQEVMGNSSYGFHATGIGKKSVNFASKEEAAKVANLIANEGMVAAISTTYTDYVVGKPEEGDYGDYEHYMNEFADFEDRAAAGDVDVEEGFRLYQVKAFEHFDDAKNSAPSSWDPETEYPTTSVTVRDSEGVSSGDIDYDTMRGVLKRVEVEFVMPKA